MKKTKFLLASALMALCVGGLATSCDNTVPPEEDPPATELPDTYSLMDHWAGNTSEEVFSVSQTETSLTMTYTDAGGELSGGWSYIAHAFAYDAAYKADFGVYKKLTFTGSLETTSGSNIVMIKFESGTGSGLYEKRFEFDSTTRTYELPLNFISDWDDVGQVLFFPNRSTSDSGSGTFTFTDISLSKADVIDENNIASDMPSLPQDWNIYKGETEKFNTMTTWGYNNEGDITTTNLDGGTYEFSWGTTKQNSYSYVNSKIKNDGEHDIAKSGLKRAVFVVNGTAGVNVLFKIESLVTHKQTEVSVTLTGEDQTVEVDAVPTLTDAAATIEDTYHLAIFPAPGLTTGITEGKMTLKECYLDNVPVTVVEEPTNERVGDEVVILNHHRADSVYTVTATGTTLKIEYDIAKFDYQSIAFKVEGTNLGELTYMAGEVTADKDVSVMLKPYNEQVNETTLALTANTKKVIEAPVNKYTAGADFIIFIGVGSTEAIKGTVTFENLRLTKDTSIVNRASGNQINITKFYTEDAAVDNFKFSTNDAGQTVITATQVVGSEDWRQIKFDIEAEDLSIFTRVGAAITTSTSYEVIIACGGTEGKYVSTANESFYVRGGCNYTEGQTTHTCLMYLVPKAEASGTTQTGTITIQSLTLFTGNATANSVDPETGVVSIDTFNSSTYYTAGAKDATTGKQVVSINKTWGTNDWDALTIPVNGNNIHKLNRLEVTIKTSDVYEVIVKPFDSVENSAPRTTEANVEMTITLSFDTSTFLNNLNKDIYIFLLPKMEGDNTTVLNDTIEFTNFRLYTA